MLVFVVFDLVLSCGVIVVSPVVGDAYRQEGCMCICLLSVEHVCVRVLLAKGFSR